MGDDTRYAYAVARVRGMETRLLDRQWVERLLSETAEGALKALADSAYQEAVSEIGRPEEIEEGLRRALAATLTELSAIAPEPALVDLFRLRWDFRNLKSLLKASLLKLEDETAGVAAGPGTIDAAALARAVRDRDYTMLPKPLAEAAREAEERYRDESVLSVIDRVIDGALWRHSFEVASEHRNTFLVDYLRTEIDLSNIKTFVRAKESGRDETDLAAALLVGGRLDLSLFTSHLGEPVDAFARAIEYGPYGALAEVFRDWSRDRSHLLELACDNLLLRKVEGGAMEAYGVEPLVSYILQRQIEIKLVRTAILAKLDGVERGEVEARLRSIHV